MHHATHERLLAKLEECEERRDAGSLRCPGAARTRINLVERRALTDAPLAVARGERRDLGRAGDAGRYPLIAAALRRRAMTATAARPASIRA